LKDTWLPFSVVHLPPGFRRLLEGDEWSNSGGGGPWHERPEKDLNLGKSPI